MSPHFGGSRRNFRISPMPLSAVAALGPELLALGGHDNAARLSPVTVQRLRR